MGRRQGAKKKRMHASPGRHTSKIKSLSFVSVISPPSSSPPFSSHDSPTFSTKKELFQRKANAAIMNLRMAALLQTGSLSFEKQNVSWERDQNIIGFVF